MNMGCSRTSVSRFRRIHDGDQGPHCRPLDPASLSLFRGDSESVFRSVRGLTQNRAHRFHLNPVPRHLD